MKNKILTCSVFFLLTALALTAWAAYHHEGEMDTGRVLELYPELAGTKLDHCALCHSGGEYVDSRGRTVKLGSCQWCHESYGYDGEGGNTALRETLNDYGKDYNDEGGHKAAITAIEGWDSDGDNFTNIQEITAGTFPGNPGDDPTQIAAPYRVYTRAQLEAMGVHTQLLLMNASRSDDDYVEYTGISMQDLLADAGISANATGILVYAPDGWSQYHPLEEDADPELYHVNGTYPPATYFYHTDADLALNPNDGWCDYSAPSCVGRNHGDPIAVSGGLKMILAWERDGVDLAPGVLTAENKLDGEGPYRVIPPQKNVSPPDQRSNSDNQGVHWPYDEFGADHNKGAASRSATIIKVEPLPAGTTDIDILEAGWPYVDQGKIIVYGNIDGTDSNGNGILDSEENDGSDDYLNPQKAAFRHTEGNQQLKLEVMTGAGQITAVKALTCDDPEVPQTNRPNAPFPYGSMKFNITGLANAETVTVRLHCPDDVPADAKFYKIRADGWHELPFAPVAGDPKAIEITLTDGDPDTDADGTANGIIVDPSAVSFQTAATAAAAAVAGSSSSSCFIDSLCSRGSTPWASGPAMWGLLLTVSVVLVRAVFDCKSVSGSRQ